MANRAYLYCLSNRPSSFADRPDTICGLSEWAYDVPFAYRVLASGDPQLCASLISDGFNDEPEDKKTKLHAISADFAAGVARFEKLAEVVRAIVGDDAAELSTALAETNAFLAKHRDRHVLLETIELDTMTKTGEKALRDCATKEIAACAKAGAAVDALSTDLVEAATQLAAAVKKKAKAPLDAFFGLTLDDGFDDVRDEKTRYALGVSYWSEVLYFELWNKQQFEEAERMQKAAAPEKRGEPDDSWKTKRTAKKQQPVAKKKQPAAKKKKAAAPKKQPAKKKKATAPKKKPVAKAKRRR